NSRSSFSRCLNLLSSPTDRMCSAERTLHSEFIIHRSGISQFRYNDSTRPNRPPTQRMPTQSNRPPTQSIRPPAQSIHPPSQSNRPPTQSIRAPTQRNRPPTQSIRPPTHSIRMPTQRIRPPTQRIRPPTQRIRPPSQSISPPTQSISPPTQSIHSPRFKRPVNPRCSTTTQHLLSIAGSACAPNFSSNQKALFLKQISRPA
uniref:Uncharacterized protein n=1 Tax=Oreochromis niloticus TaxID=8128 RepID=A0A669CXK1_ORENI